MQWLHTLKWGNIPSWVYTIQWRHTYSCFVGWTKCSMLSWFFITIKQVMFTLTPNWLCYHRFMYSSWLLTIGLVTAIIAALSTPLIIYTSIIIILLFVFTVYKIVSDALMKRKSWLHASLVHRNVIICYHWSKGVTCTFKNTSNSLTTC